MCDILNLTNPCFELFLYMEKYMIFEENDIERYEQEILEAKIDLVERRIADVQAEMVALDNVIKLSLNSTKNIMKKLQNI